jgi:PhzF family phenazine biosynthesis protein
MQIQEVKCFGGVAGEGNPALVVSGDCSSIEERSNFARIRNVTCVFLDPCDDPAVACSLDYFYPHTRSPLCLHATLAAALVLLAGKEDEVVVKTALRGQKMSLSRRGDEYFVQLSRQAAPQVEVSEDLVRSLLMEPEMTFISAPVVASVGSPKLLIEVAGSAALHALRPDLARISDWGKQNGVSGCYVYCRLGDEQFEGRNFNHLDPALEDSATGVAAGALTEILGHGITLHQGIAVGKSCRIVTGMDGNQIFVGGKVGK